MNDPGSEAMPAGLAGNAFASLFQAVNGLRNRPAILAMLGCTFVGVIVAGLLLAMSGTLGFLAGLLAFLVWIVAIGTGVNAAGLLQMDHARGISPRSLPDALVYGLMCIPKLIVLGLAFFAVEVAVFLVLAILMVICKVPFLGPLLFVVVFPLSVVVAGVTIAGLFICMVLSLPAIWQGASITRALAQTLVIVKSRLVETVLLLLVVGLLCFAVGLIIFGVLGAGLMPTLGMSLSIVGIGGLGVESLMAMSQGMGGAGSGHAIAGAIGGALLWAVAASLVGQVYLLGLSLVYLRVTEGLDLSASEASLRATFDDAKRRTAELGEKARQATQRDGTSTGAATATAAGLAGSAASRSAATGASASPAEVSGSASFDPPAYAAAPGHAFDQGANNPFAALSIPDEPTVAPMQRTEGPMSGGTDIALPFDDPVPAPVTTPASPPPPATSAPAYAAPPAWTPPPAPAAAAPLVPPLPALTTCPQCLSSVTPEDVFCGTCGYRLR